LRLPATVDYDNNVIESWDDVELTEYALLRMRQRDILHEEVLVVLAAPRSQHRRRMDGRWEGTRRIGRRSLLVVYRREGTKVIVINAMWE